MSSKSYTLILSAAEVRALFTLAGEAAEGLLTDAAASRAYIGNGAQVAAAKRAMEKLAALRSEVSAREPT
jgi:hypothetical protein